MMLNSYDRLLVSAVVRLIENGTRDPTIIEIGHEAFNKPLPLDDPWLPTEVLGHEVFQGLHARLNKIGHALLANHDILTMPVAMPYYETGQRDRSGIPSEAEILVSIPRRFYKSAGLRAVLSGDDDPFFPVYLKTMSGRAAVALRNTYNRTGKALERNAMTVPTGRDIMQTIDDQTGPRPRLLLNDRVPAPAE